MTKHLWEDGIIYDEILGDIDGKICKRCGRAIYYVGEINLHDETCGAGFVVSIQDDEEILEDNYIEQ